MCYHPRERERERKRAKRIDLRESDYRKTNFFDFPNAPSCFSPFPRERRSSGTGEKFSRRREMRFGCFYWNAIMGIDVAGDTVGLFARRLRILAAKALFNLPLPPLTRSTTFTAIHQHSVTSNVPDVLKRRINPVPLSTTVLPLLPPFFVFANAFFHVLTPHRSSNSICLVTFMT